MINVYNFKVWDAAFGGWRYPAAKATSAAIRKLGGKLIIGTNQKVSPSLLDESGAYCPMKYLGQHGANHGLAGYSDGGLDAPHLPAPIHETGLERRP